MNSELKQPLAIDLESLAQYISDVHRRNTDGCKGTCFHRTIGFHSSDTEGSYWYAIFGGYCLGTLPRQVEIRSASLLQLEIDVKNVLHRAEAECLRDPYEGPMEYPEIGEIMNKWIKPGPPTNVLELEEYIYGLLCTIPESNGAESISGMSSKLALYIVNDLKMEFS